MYIGVNIVMKVFKGYIKGIQRVYKGCIKGVIPNKIASTQHVLGHPDGRTPRTIRCCTARGATDAARIASARRTTGKTIEVWARRPPRPSPVVDFLVFVLLCACVFLEAAAAPGGGRRVRFLRVYGMEPLYAAANSSADSVCLIMFLPPGWASRRASVPSLPRL